MENKTCPKCGAHWIAGQLYWATGAKASEADLAGLVCDKYSDEQCINTLKGSDHGGMTWEQRLDHVNAALAEFETRGNS